MRVKRRKEVSPAGRPFFRIPFFLLVCCCIISETNAFVEQRCKTMDIRNYPNGRTWPRKDAKKDQSEFTQLDLNCTVLEGSFLMSMVSYTDSDSGNRTFTREDFPRYEHLREITGSLLIFQVNGLKSLKWLFPNLRVIGGQNLIQHYSLIVYQNDELEELGLDNLRVIRNGGVRMAENPKLCNAKSVNWRHLQFGTINDVLVDDSSEISVGEGKIEPCAEVCTPKDQNRCLQSEKGISCWSTESCQLGCEHDRNGTHLGPGCSDDTWERCHSECIAGCSRPNNPTACFACAHISHEGRCLPKCPEPLYSFLDRRCVTKATCEGLDPKKSAGQIDTWKAFKGRCHYHCPDQYEEDPANNKTCRICRNDCIRKCKGNITIDSLSKARTLEKCTVIDGHLEIEMRIGMESVAASEMTKAFGRIKIIDGYLLIRLTPSLVNLYMFKSLHTITGRYLYRDKYAISVYENDNLQKLFPPNTDFNVTAGYFQFQNNRMLCFDHITNLMKGLDRDKEIDDFDQSKNSNGDKAICSESSFDVLVAAVSSTSFRLQWKAFNTTDMDYRKFLGYEIKYKEVDFPDKSMSIDDDRSACSDSWNNHFLEVKTSVTEHGHVQMDHKSEEGELVMEEIANELIKPNTYYAFYVTTSMVRHEGATNAVSRIGFLRTHFGNPDPPIWKVYQERGTDTIFLQWDPPTRPNGEITHYVVTYKPQMDNKYVEEYGDGCYEDHDPRNEKITEDPTTLSPGQQLLLSTVAPPDTCAAHGCCACAADAKSTSEQRQEAANFENALQDIVFVPKPEESLRVKRSIRPPNQDKDANSRIEELLNKIDKHEALNEPTKINVTGTNITLSGLHHYTDYFISISACQDVKAEAHHCSMKKAWKNIMTRGIREADLVDNRTVSAVVYNATGVVNITWKGPKEPNGRVRLYEITVINMDTKTTPHKQCRGYKDGWTPEKGIEFTGLSNGKYHVEIRTRSLLPKMSEPCIYEFFEIAVPGFWTTERIIIWGTIASVFLTIFSIIAYFFFKKYYGKKMIEYATQLISANPEYLSQQDVYKADEWELTRGKLTVEDCIGKGTFGQVFKGYGHQLQTVRGHIFGPCAIKTVTESSNSAERIHFLLEASVMKKFDSSYIVKLFGVVSDGQPVFVVMELMDNGNLRDYLRARRPDAEENVDNLPAPTEDEMLRWAIQIADGMAYLESLKFCHRDLAARNCMVSKDLVVKIGDFGMTRDLCYREYYKPAGRRMMPVRWMAPESLLDGKHDIKSDVWSYGVVLYEMWTGGQLPYTGLANEEVIEHIRKGKSLDPPPLTPQTWALLMKECFSHASRERPNFFTIVDELYDLSESKKVDLQGFNEMSFVFMHPELALAESNYGDDDNPYQPDPLSNFINDQFGSGEETQREEPVNNRGAQDTPDWEEGVSLRNGILVAEHEV